MTECEDKSFSYELPDGLQSGDQVLLHVCCAPCSCAIIEGLLAAGMQVSVFFYNPNIHPKEEYDRRKTEVIRFCGRHAVPFIDADYDTDRWFACTKGLEQEPERGRRCEACFLMRLERTAALARDKGVRFFATSLSISRHKDQAQIHRAGHKAAEAYDNVSFWDCNWRQKGGAQRGAALAKEEGFYRQKYCGCVYSLRD